MEKRLRQIQIANQYKARNWRLRKNGMTYHEFLKSDIWKETKEYLKNFDEYKKCKICSSEKYLNMHHTSYVCIFKPSFKKRKQHIVALCFKCHNKVHEIAQSKNMGLGQAVKWTLKKYLETTK